MAMAQHDDFQRQFDRRKRRHHGERHLLQFLGTADGVTRKSRPTARLRATVDFSGRRVLETTTSCTQAPSPGPAISVRANQLIVGTTIFRPK